MRLKLSLPPNLKVCAPRDAIPTKVEVTDETNATHRPESLGEAEFSNLDERSRVAAFSLLQWGGGALSSFVQLTREQLKQLLKALENTSAFYWVNDPRTPIPWESNKLTGVSESLSNPNDRDTATSSNTATTAAEKSPERDRQYDGSPMLVDGSSHFLAITLPSREHPLYSEIRELLDQYRFKLEPRNRKWWLRDRHQTLSFLSAHWQDLEDRYNADFSDNFLSRTSNIKDVEFNIDAEEDSNGYRVSFSLTAPGANESALNQCVASGNTYVDTGNQVYLFRKDKLKKCEALQKSLALTPNAPFLHRGSYQIPASRIPEIEDDLAEANPNFNPPGTWKARSAALKDLSKLPSPPLNERLQQRLRDYQKIGISWMLHLFRNRLGGILADEMGLGKTVQALALLSVLKELKSTGSQDNRRRRRNDSPNANTHLSLVVCPASLVENWRREANTYCPELKVFINHRESRISKLKTLADLDLVITSYGTVIRDLDQFKPIKFRCAIADEAQHIKNRRTQNAKALASLSSSGRFLLTGTPVENSVQDLISLMDFILPGSPNSVPKDARGEERAWHEKRILRQAGPYILRRKKSEVASELPSKIEQTLFVNMTSEQRSLYQKAKQSAESEISAMEKSGANEGALRMKALTQLLRLRQICCDPRLLNKQCDPEASAKLSSFLELIEESIDGGHRLLVFSQFVSLLSLLSTELEQQNIEYAYIDGSTRDRMAQVDRFQNDSSIPVFLISLKAGGVGLNLTGADTVIHYDPWWNPAAEAQATDRAHRIGQTKIVTSYRFIAADSVEEKVLQMQDRKRKLLEDVFEASEAANSQISLEDLKELLD
ncbi:MAG: serine/threonine protein kinase [Opitutaceae bacterium]|nr:serine/threonine protein kinase [Opitutaceae bacterium]